jgi:hypothetical protein
MRARNFTVLRMFDICNVGSEILAPIDNDDVDGVIYMTGKNAPPDLRAPLALRQYSCGCGARH